MSQGRREFVDGIARLPIGLLVNFNVASLRNGIRRAQVRQAGNAVTPPAARDLITAITETL